MCGLRKIFDIDWKIAKTGKIPWQLKLPWTRQSQQKPAVELVASPPELLPTGVRPAEEALVELIKGAKERIRIQLLSYKPIEKYTKVKGEKHYWSTVDDALREAALLRGVKVELLVSDWNTKGPDLSPLKSLAEIPGINVQVATIPKHSSGPIPFARVIHSKYMTVDGNVLWLGTSNWSEGYFRNSRNVELIFHDLGLTQIGDQIFDKLWKSQYTKNVLNYGSSPK